MFIPGIILHFAAAAASMALIDWIGLRPWRQAVHEHWTERARLLWPARVTSAQALFSVPIILLGVHESLDPQSLAGMAANGLGGFFGCLLGGYPMARELFPACDFREWLRQVLCGVGAKCGLYGPLLAAALVMPHDFGIHMALIALATLVFFVWVKRGLFLPVLRLAKFQTPPGPRLRRIVAETSGRMNVPVRGLWEMKSAAANAMALIATGELVFTSRLLDICSDEEIAAICAHELAHLAESKPVLWARIACQLVGIFPLIFIKPVFHHFGPLALLIPSAAWYARRFLTIRLSVRMEKRADLVALREQANDGVYARALEKLYQANMMPAVGSQKFPTHPDLYDRMLAAGLTPDFSKPAKPSHMNGIGKFVYAGMLIAVAALTFALLRHRDEANAPDAETSGRNDVIFETVSAKPAVLNAPPPSSFPNNA